MTPSIIARLITDDPDIFNEEVVKPQTIERLLPNKLQVHDAIYQYLLNLESQLLEQGFSSKELKRYLLKSIQKLLPTYVDIRDSHILDQLKQDLKPTINLLYSKNQQTKEKYQQIQQALQELGLDNKEVDYYTSLILQNPHREKEIIADISKKGGEDIEGSNQVILTHGKFKIRRITEWHTEGKTNNVELGEGQPFHTLLGDENGSTLWCVQFENYFDNYIRNGPLYLITYKDKKVALASSEIPDNGGGIRDRHDHEIYNTNLYRPLKQLLPKIASLKEPELIKAFGYYYPEELYDLGAEIDRYNSTLIKIVRAAKSEDELRGITAENSNAIRYIKNPSEEVQLIAIERNGDAIRYIKNPSEEVKLAAVKHYGLAIRYIKNPSEEVKLIVAKHYGLLIRFIDNPSEEVQLAAVEKNADAIRYIDNPSEEIQLATVTKSGGTIRHIDNPSEEVQLAAIEKNYNAIQYIKNPSEEVQLAAIAKSCSAIDLIKNPSERVKLAVAQRMNI